MRAADPLCDLNPADDPLIQAENLSEQATASLAATNHIVKRVPKLLEAGCPAQLLLAGEAIALPSVGDQPGKDAPDASQQETEMKKPILNCRALVLIATIATFPAMSVPARAAVPDMAASAVAFMPSDVDKFIDTLPLPSPRELPELARKLGKLIGKALGLEFALKLGACAVAADNVQEFRTCVRGLVLGTQS